MSTFHKWMKSKPLLVTLFGLLVLITACSESENSTAQTSETYSISGRLSGDICQEVTIAISGTAAANLSTDAGGNFSASGLPDGSYTVTPSKPGYTFTPTSRSVVISGSNSAGNDYTTAAVLYTITGAITGDVTAGATVTVSGTTEGGAGFGPVEVVTAADGGYTVADVPNGNYTIATARPGYEFNPTGIAVVIIAGNSPNNDFVASLGPDLVFNASGGSGINGSGGAGGTFYADSFGSISIFNSGSVDASFTLPPVTPEFGGNHFIVGDPDLGTPEIEPTIVQLDEDSVNGGLYTTTGATNLYLGNGDDNLTNDPAVTGLTINAGATLQLVQQGDGYGSLWLDNDLVIYGTITSDLSASFGLYIEANLIDVEDSGKITASASESDSSGGEIYLGRGEDHTQVIINRGTIEAKGDGSGNGGYIYFEPSDFVANYGTVDASGGDTGGQGGEFEVYADYGDFYSSGTIRMNGGDGQSGGVVGIVTAYAGSEGGRNGDIIISGIWEAMGGEGAGGGDGGGGGHMFFYTLGMGAVKVNASMSVKGGSGTGGPISGGPGGEIGFYSSNESVDNPSPGKISIGGTYHLGGGDGDQNGGDGGYFNVQSGSNDSGLGSDLELVGFPVMVLNGGSGGENGGSASDEGSFGLYTNSWEPSVAKSITNQADVQARGGNATLEGASAGSGGYVEMTTGTPGDEATIINNAGNIDVSGGEGETGGSGGEVYMQAQHIGNSNNLTAEGGDGTTMGGSGGNITLTSDDGTTPTANTGNLSVAGGLPNGTPGTVGIDDGGGPM